VYTPKIQAYQMRLMQMRAQAAKDQRDARFAAANGNQPPQSGPPEAGPTVNPGLDAFGNLSQPPPFIPPDPTQERPWRNM
jgi:hypothetical protein